MPDIAFSIAGAHASAAADALIAALDPAGVFAARKIDPAASPDGDRKSVDWIALASLVVSIPGAVFSVQGMLDRADSRRKAQAAIDAAERAKTEGMGDIHLMLPGGAQRPLDQLDADMLLDLWEMLETQR